VSLEPLAIDYQPDWSVIPNNLDLLWTALVATFKVSIVAELIAIAIGLIMGVLRAQKHPLLRAPARIYVEFFRSVPILVLLLWLFFGLKIVLNLDLTVFMAGILGLGLFYGAFLAEVFRAGLQAVPSGQREAGLTLGLSRWHTMTSVVLPQAIRIVVPPLANSYVGMLKDATLVSVIGLVELLRAGQLIVARTFRPFEIFTFIALIYLVITLIFSQLVIWFEKKLPIE
jgi:His/Glu/Gln/Arg/opine family amino acid ABC transporter permease subunit